MEDVIESCELNLNLLNVQILNNIREKNLCIEAMAKKKLQALHKHISKGTH